MLLIPVSYKSTVLKHREYGLFLVVVGKKMYYPTKEGFSKCENDVPPKHFRMEGIPINAPYKKRVVHTELVSFVEGISTYEKCEGETTKIDCRTAACAELKRHLKFPKEV